MLSHRYQVSFRDWLHLVLPTLLAVAAGAVLLKSANRLGALPAPAVGWDAELTVLDHQSRACQEGGPAAILLAGDSTCLAGVDALDLSRQLPGQPGVLNLALFVWLDLEVYGEIVSDYAAAHPGQVRAVVLLLTAAKLTTMSGGEASNDLWRQVHPKAGQGSRPAEPATPPDWLGVRLLRRHLLSHCLATPLRGSGAEFFGFSSEIESYMVAHRGSLPTFGTAVLPRRPPRSKAAPPEWVLTPELEGKSRAFRTRMPAGAKLLIGLTPGMEGTSSPDERHRRETLLRQWNVWIGADALLTNLPATLPTIFFSPGAHLNQVGQKAFTKVLAREMAPLLEAPH